MNYTLSLSEKFKGATLPDPHIGCVITDFNNKIIGEGSCEYYGREHAIENAFNSIKNINNIMIINNIYITVEPYPSKIDILLKYRPKNIYIGIYNPDPSFTSHGYQILIDNGINVIVGLEKDRIMESLKYYIHYYKSCSPFFTGKIAMYMNNVYTTATKDKFLIYNEKANIDNNKMRSNCNAILVGSNTWLLDNPDLNIGYNYKKCYNYTIFVIDNNLNFVNRYDSNPFLSNIIYVCFNREHYYNFGHLANVLFCESIKDLKRKMFEMNIVHCLIHGGGDTLNRFSSVIDEFIYYINLNYKNNITLQSKMISEKQLFNFNRNLQIISTENFDNIVKIICKSI